MELRSIFFSKVLFNCFLIKNIDIIVSFDAGRLIREYIRTCKCTYCAWFRNRLKGPFKYYVTIEGGRGGVVGSPNSTWGMEGSIKVSSEIF